MPQIDWTISLGTILHLIGTMLAILGLYAKLANKYAEIRAEVEKRFTALEVKADLLMAWFQGETIVAPRRGKG